MSGIMILTSSGFSNPKILDRVIQEIGDAGKAKVALITTAPAEKDKDEYVVLAKNQFEESGFRNIDLVDLEFEETNFEQYDLIYVAGGNTFKLLKWSKERNFDSEIKKLLARGGIYIGVSAGSLIVGPHIHQAAEVDPDINEIGLEDLDAFNLIDFEVFPHYIGGLEEEIVEYEKRHQIESRRLKDGEAIIIKDDKIEKISNF